MISYQLGYTVLYDTMAGDIIVIINDLQLNLWYLLNGEEKDVTYYDRCDKHARATGVYH